MDQQQVDWSLTELIHSTLADAASKNEDFTRLHSLCSSKIVSLRRQFPGPLRCLPKERKRGSRSMFLASFQRESFGTKSWSNEQLVAVCESLALEALRCWSLFSEIKAQRKRFASGCPDQSRKIQHGRKRLAKAVCWSGILAKKFSAEEKFSSQTSLEIAAFDFWLCGVYAAERSRWQEAYSALSQARSTYDSLATATGLAFFAERSKDLEAVHRLAIYNLKKSGVEVAPLDPHLRAEDVCSLPTLSICGVSATLPNSRLLQQWKTLEGLCDWSRPVRESLAEWDRLRNQLQKIGRSSNAAALELIPFGDYVALVRWMAALKEATSDGRAALRLSVHVAERKAHLMKRLQAQIAVPKDSFLFSVQCLLSVIIFYARSRAPGLSPGEREKTLLEAMSFARAPGSDVVPFLRVTFEDLFSRIAKEAIFCERKLIQHSTEKLAPKLSAVALHPIHEDLAIDLITGTESAPTQPAEQPLDQPTAGIAQSIGNFVRGFFWKR